MTFDSTLHPRENDGKFAEKVGSASAVTIPAAIEFQESPLSEADVDRYIGGDCNHLAVALRERLGDEWEPVILTADGHGWTHCALRHPDGRVVDASGLSDGDHILNDDRFVGAFSDEELEDADDIWLDTMPDDEQKFIYSDFENADKADAYRVADELTAWLKAA